MISSGISKIRGWLLDHWGLKLLSLFLAIGFWFYALGEEMVEAYRNIPLRIEVSGKQFSIAKRSTETLHIGFRAPRSVLSVLSESDVIALHKIAGTVNAGEYSFRVSADDIKLPSSGIRITSILPEVVTVVIDEAIIKKVPVIPNFIGEPAYGYKILRDKVKLDPNAVLVEGPKEKLEQLDGIKTEPIELVGRTRSFRKIAGLVFEPYLRLATEPVTDVFVPIREEYLEREFVDLPVKPLGLPENGHSVSLDPEKVVFVLKGPKSELDRLSEKGVFIYVDVTGLKKGTYELPALFILPEAVSLKSDIPQIKITVEKNK